MKKIKITEALSLGFNIFFKKPFLLMGAMIALIFVPFAIANLVKLGLGFCLVSDNFRQGIFTLITFLIESIFMAGFITILLKVKRGEETDLDEFDNKGEFVKEIIIGGIFFSLIVLAGTLLFIVPGVWIATRMQFYSFLIVDKKMKAIDALKESFDITKGHGWRLFFFSFIVSVLIFFAGLLFFIVGALPAVIIFLLAQAAIYDYLFNDGELTKEAKA